MRRLLAILALVSVPAFAGDPAVEAPESASWARFKPGAWCRTRTIFPRDNGVKVTIERREELVRVGATDYELKSEWVKDGVHEDLNLGPSNRQFDETKWTRTDKKEDVEVEGKKFSCEIFTATEGRPVASLREWRATVGGREVVLRFETTRTLAESTETITMRVRSLAETVKVGKKDVSCVVTETVRENGDTKYTSTKWTSLDVPGGVVKEQEKETSKGREPRISTVELLEFDGELAAPAGK